MTYDFWRCYFTGETVVYRHRQGRLTPIYRDRDHATALRVLRDLRKAAS